MKKTTNIHSTISKEDLEFLDKLETDGLSTSTSESVRMCIRITRMFEEKIDKLIEIIKKGN